MLINEAGNSSSIVSSALDIGYRTSNGAHPFNGHIDEVTIWDKALSQEELQSIMFNGLDPSEQENLVGYWRMERGNGNTALDLTENRNHGTIYGAEWGNDRILFFPFATFTTDAPNTTNLSSIEVDVEFNLDVSDFTASDLVVENGTISDLSGEGKEYAFTLSPSSDGLVWVFLPAGVVVDQDGNYNTASDTLSLIYDSTPPTITLSSAAFPLTTDSPIPINISFSEPVNGFTVEDVDIDQGSITKFSDGFSYALSFGGGDDQVLGTASSSLDVSGTNELTMSAWVRPVSNTGSGVDMIFAHTDNEFWYQYGLGMDLNNKLYFLSGTGNFESGISKTLSAEIENDELEGVRDELIGKLREVSSKGWIQTKRKI